MIKPTQLRIGNLVTLSQEIRKEYLNKKS